MTVFNNKLFFKGHGITNGRELWQYDGTNTPTMVHDINSGAGGFGTSAARDTGAGLATAEATPGPGAYVADSAFTAGASTKPSAAFASATEAGARNATIDVSDAPCNVMFNPDSVDGMAATAGTAFSLVCHGQSTHL